MKKRIKIIRPIILIILLAFVLYLLKIQREQSVKNYDTMVVSENEVSDTISAEGKIVAEKEATLNFLIPSKLTYLGVKKGDKVNKYELLAGVDAKELITAEIGAKYNYISADANAKEIEDQVKNHDADESFEQKNIRIKAQTSRDFAWDNWLLAKRKIGDASLYSPFQGVVTNITVNTVGDIVTNADSITVIDPKSIIFQAEVDETDFGKLKVGQKANIYVDAYPDKTFTGSVKYIAPVGIKTQAGGIKVLTDIRLDPYDANLITELNGTANFIMDTRKTITIPKDYVITEKEKVQVYIVNDNKVTLKEISLGNEFPNGDIEVLSGLTSGDIIAKNK